MAPPPLRTAAVASRTIAWREAGAGPALVLLHGIGGSSETWENQLGSFAATHRVIAWDAPGYGGSDDLPMDAPMPGDYAEALLGLLDAVGVARAHVVGQSLGAIMAAAFCRRYADRALSYTFCQGLVGLGGLERGAREASKRARLAAFDEAGPERFAATRGPGVLAPGAPDALTATVVALMAKVRPRGFHQATEMLAQADIFRAAPHIRVPALVICGGADKVAPEADCRRVAEALGAAFALIPGVGHYGCLEDPAAFDAALRPFLAAHAG